MRTAYIAGPMTGLPEHNYPAFFEAEEQIKAVFPHLVLKNPARTEFDDGGVVGSLSQTEYLKTGFDLLLDCDAIFLLPGWTRSSGAKAELQLALALQLKVYYVDEYGKVAFIS